MDLSPFASLDLQNEAEGRREAAALAGEQNHRFRTEQPGLSTPSWTADYLLTPTWLAPG